ncbi:hypothetical protein [Cardinium endosymbiont of Oedothorax gibbosus]|uniref:hypothetical protein n=1 Tax=Cardinium endosymbiont of Oedothorax gibbosus TaxID=931101 RepID=UPI003F6CB99A
MKNQVSQLLYCEQSEAIDMLNFKWSNHFFTLDHCRDRKHSYDSKRTSNRS